MQVTKKTPRENITIQGMGFACPVPFREGHTCTAQEASALNQLTKENLRNNFAPRVKVALENATPEDQVQADFEAYAVAYEFGERKGGGSRDPVQTEAMNLARILVKKALVKAGKPVKDVGAKEVTRLAEEAIEKNSWIVDRARETVAARQLEGAELELGL